MEEQKRAEGVPLPPAARVGGVVADIDTPSLILDLDAFEENLRTMQVLAERNGVALRPHAKAHKCPEIALRQIALGAQGICCQKVSEAVPFVAAGVRDIHISNEVVGAAKLALLARLARQARVSVCVDHAQALHALSGAMGVQSASIAVLVEIDVGQKRCGVQTPDEALALARLAQQLPNVEFVGLQAYHGGLQHKRSLDQRKKSCDKTLQVIRAFLSAFEQAAIPCPIVTGGGTGSAAFDVGSKVFTEIQAGSYPFMDGDYASNDWGHALSFKHSLFLLGTVMSTPTAERAIVDMGLKSTSAESGLPQPADASSGWSCLAINDEHTILQAANAKSRPALGAQVRLIPGHCDPTFNLHDSIVVVRGQQVEAVWPISARGLSR
ncbi:DSD1 family PLP-dependent enzyme [Paralcaligenes ureilyticus]|uniref:D-serine deaminase-like pyridoxal phosphate-dependent protein n=1 Tax=Paralcaligenes ureilyticus TaxID=627131 RepID=A0A4R3LYK2_9BURK|nr:DSD1 family PLP-dependent enzyme [Paralcaligenes ureilyticus]TCT05791.1 D-serine deaminase-like pyridoxal phosphate-dependent protein [Paralcaligenes ureilyticus]